MTPADERIAQMLAKWQTSLDLHLRYTKLPDDEYWQVQAWPEHERPNRWIVELARQRLEALQRIVQTRISAGDPSLSEALELMAFLSNLVGSEHLERHIPQAEDKTTAKSVTPAADAAKPAADAAKPAAGKAKPAADKAKPAAATAGPAAEAARPAAKKRARQASTAVRAKQDTTEPAQEPMTDEDVVTEDAVRLLSWGKAWHELPEAIERMADRPNATVVRKILKLARDDIEQKVDAGLDKD